MRGECEVEAGERIEKVRLWPWRTIAWTKEMSVRLSPSKMLGLQDEKSL
jgi:hypothetical protein